MVETTVEVGYTEVQIEETDDGFEVSEAEDGPELGVYLRAEDDMGDYGFEIPIDGPYELSVPDYRDPETATNLYKAAWDTDADIADDLKNDGANGPTGAPSEYDGHANVGSFEIVRRFE